MKMSKTILAILLEISYYRTTYTQFAHKNFLISREKATNRAAHKEPSHQERSMSVTNHGELFGVDDFEYLERLRKVVTIEDARRRARPRVCRNCGAEIAGRFGRRYCSLACAIQYAGPRQADRTGRLLGPRFPDGIRSCHDCGRPTWNYRCDLCLEDWRSRHGVPHEPDEQ